MIRLRRHWTRGIVLGKLTPILMAVIASACESPPAKPPAKSDEQRRAELEQRLSGWHGHDINELIGLRGQPTVTYQMPNGNLMVTYDRASAMTLSGVTFSYRCTVNFIADKESGVIIGHS